MTKILATVGPVSSDKNLKFLLNKCDMVRLNMSHNTKEWHKRNINKIKKINNKKYILVDIPGAKPRTLNKNIIKIKKDKKQFFLIVLKIKKLYLFQILYQN